MLHRRSQPTVFLRKCQKCFKRLIDMESNTTPRLLGATAAARYLGISRATLHRLVASGALVPAEYTASGYRRFSPHELQRFQSTRHMRPRIHAPETEDVLSENLRRHSVLLDLAELICGLHTAESICMAAATVVRDALKSGDRASVWLVDGRGESLIPAACVGYPPDLDVSPFAIARDSAAARALKTGQPIACEDVLQYSLEGINIGRIRRADLRAFVAVPMIGSREARGLLLVGCRHPAAFPTEDIVFLSRLAKLLAQSLESALHVEQCEQVYETFHALSEGVIERRTDQELASRAASALGRLTNADFVLVSVNATDSNRGGAWLGAWSPDGLRIEDLPSVPWDPTLTQQLRTERRTLRIEDAQSYEGMACETRHLATLLDAPMWHVAPLRGAGRVYGAVSIGFKNETQLSQSMLRSISAVALHLSLALISPAREAVAPISAPV